MQNRTKLTANLSAAQTVLPAAAGGSGGSGFLYFCVDLCSASLHFLAEVIWTNVTGQG